MLRLSDFRINTSYLERIRTVNDILFKVKVEINDVAISIVTRNGKIVWKYGPNWPFYAVMLRSKLW